MPEHAGLPTLASGYAPITRGISGAGMSTAELNGLNRCLVGKSERLPTAYWYRVSNNSGRYGKKRAWKQGEYPRSSNAACMLSRQP